MDRSVAPLIAVRKRMKKRVKKFCAGDMRTNRNNHCIICGPKGAGKSTLVRELAEYANTKGARVIHVDGIDLTRTPTDLLRDHMTELADCTDLQDMFNVLVRNNTRVVLIIDEIHYIFRHAGGVRVGLDFCWTQQCMQHLHRIGTTDVERSNVLCTLTGSSAYTLQLLHAQLSQSDATALGFHGYVACNRLVNLNHQKFVAETITLAEPNRSQMKQILRLLQPKTRDDADSKSDHSSQGDGGSTTRHSAQQDGSENSFKTEENAKEPEILSLNVDEQLRRLFASTAGLIGPIALVADDRPSFVHNLLVAIENDKDTFEVTREEDIEEVLEQIIAQVVNEQTKLEQISPAAHAYCQRKARQLISNLGLPTDRDHTSQTWAQQLQRNWACWSEPFGNPRAELTSEDVATLRDKFVIKVERGEAQFCFPWQPFLCADATVPPRWLILALSNLAGEAGKQMEKKLYDGMAASDAAAITLRMGSVNRSPVKLRVHPEKVQALNFRTMAEATIYQLTTDHGSGGFMSLRSELWLFQVKLTLGVDTGLANQDFEEIRARFDVEQQRIAHRPRFRSTHRVVLTNKICKSRAAAESARRQGLVVVWRDQLEEFWLPRVYLAACNHVDDDGTALRCFFPSRA